MATTQYYLLHLLVFFCLFSYTLCLFSYTLQDNTCRDLGCGEGKCVSDNDDNNSSVSYHCECNRGWKKMMVAPMPYPSCIVPNCTLNFGCGSGSSPPPPPPPPPQSIFNNTNVCNFIWCGEGDCVAKGKTHDCKCHTNALNLNNSTSICVKQCSFGGDCKQLGISLAKPPSLSPPQPPPPPTHSSANSLCCGMAQLFRIVVFFTSSVIAMANDPLF